VPTEDGGEVENDWYCTKCFEEHFGDEADSEPNIDNLHLACIHCAGNLLRPYQKAEVLRAPDIAGPPKFLLVRDGQCEIYQIGELHGILLARTREMAKTYVGLKNKPGDKVVIAEIAAVTNLPLKEFLDQKREEASANCAFVIREIVSEQMSCDVLLPPSDPSS
jgi:hypothetical protein